MSNIREVLEGLMEQGISEAWRYQFDTSPVNGTATGTPTMIVYLEKGDNEANWQDVSSVVASGSCSLSSTTITTSILQSLRVNATYRCVVTWSVGSSQTRSRYFRVRGKL